MFTGENFAFSLALVMKRGLLKLLHGFGRVGMPSKPTIPDSQGQVSSNKFNYRVWFIIESGYNIEYK